MTSFCPPLIPKSLHWLGERPEADATGHAMDMRGCVLYFDRQSDCLEFMRWLEALAASPRQEPKAADSAMREIWTEWFRFYEKHFRGPGIAISMADQQAFYEIAQPIMRAALAAAGRVAGEDVLTEQDRKDICHVRKSYNESKDRAIHAPIHHVKNLLRIVKKLRAALALSPGKGEGWREIELRKQNEVLRAALMLAKDRLYNAFEPDNQSETYMRITSVLATLHAPPAVSTSERGET